MMRWLVVVWVLALSACASLPEVKPWQKAVLARRDMALERDPLGSRFRAHMLQAKEAASGGAEVGGGGRGCN